MNITILKGRFTKDIEIVNTQGGLTIGKSSIAVNDGFGDKKKTYFFNIVSFGKTAENIAKFFSKGSEILITGKLSQSRYTNKDGKNVSSIEVIVNQFDFCGSKKSESVVEKGIEDINNTFYSEAENSEGVPF